MAERARIAQYFAPLTAHEPGSFSLTDDAAILTPPSGKQLVITTDSVIESIHVLPHTSPQHIAQKLIRRNLSDLAAMGATPWRYTLNLHTPSGLADAWFAEFAATLASEQQQFGMVLIGGDSTSGMPDAPIHTTLTCFGLLKGAALRRNGTRAGDDIYVSGTIGDAALGLKLLQHELPQTFPDDAALITRYHTPEPRLKLGHALHGIATAALDVSDGLLADIAQLCNASNVGAQILRDAIPRSAAFNAHLTSNPALWDAALNGGDDYELCFTAPASARGALNLLAQQMALPLTRIGTVTARTGIVLLDEKSEILPSNTHGFEHR